MVHHEGFAMGTRHRGLSMHCTRGSAARNTAMRTTMVQVYFPFKSPPCKCAR